MHFLSKFRNKLVLAKLPIYHLSLNLMRDNNVHFLKQTVWSCARAVYLMSFTYLSVVIRLMFTFLRWDVHLLSHLCRIGLKQLKYMYGWLKKLFWCHFCSSSLKVYLSQSESSEPLKNNFLPVVKVLISFNIRLSQVKSNMNFSISVLSFIYAFSTSV